MSDKEVIKKFLEDWQDKAGDKDPMMILCRDFIDRKNKEEEVLNIIRNAQTQPVVVNYKTELNKTHYGQQALTKLENLSHFIRSQGLSSLSEEGQLDYLIQGIRDDINNM